MEAVQKEEQPIKPAALQGFKLKLTTMINFTRRKRIFNSMVLVTCLIVLASFVLEAKTFLAGSVSVSIRQENADINVSVKAPKNTSLQFYMFSTEGTLVKQIEITGPKNFNISHLSKGYYLYELFKKDERLKSGDIQLK